MSSSTDLNTERNLAPRQQPLNIPIQELPNIFHYGVISERFFIKNLVFLNSFRKYLSENSIFRKLLGKVRYGGFVRTRLNAEFGIPRKKTRNQKIWNSEFVPIFVHVFSWILTIKVSLDVSTYNVLLKRKKHVQGKLKYKKSPLNMKRIRFFLAVCIINCRNIF